jgi:hypothetical protein
VARLTPRIDSLRPERWERHYGRGRRPGLIQLRSMGRGSAGFVGEGERSGLLERDWASSARLVQAGKPVLRGREEAGLGLLQAGGAGDETSDFGQ